MKKQQTSSSKKPQAWVVSVSMGFGHQRTAYPLRHLAPGGNFLNANDYDGIPVTDETVWESSRRFYEFMSNFKRVPLIGPLAFALFDRFQRILGFYPRRDLSAPVFNLKQGYRVIERGWGEHLINKLRVRPLPFISTFFTPAFMAEYFGYPGKVYCVVADADIFRGWAPLKPAESHIIYCAPTPRVVERLAQYGVARERIVLTGYPLPKENIGSEKMEVAKRDLARRLVNLDPKGTYRARYASLIKKYVGPLPKAADHPLTVMFSIGGAGAQNDIAGTVLKALRGKIAAGAVRLIIAAGSKEHVRDELIKETERLGLGGCLGNSLVMLWDGTMESYFSEFNKLLRTTDILWTKPSELSFYAALGLPVIIAPTIGSQEEFNRDWLLELGAGRLQQPPAYVAEWLFDFLENGWFAEAAMQGFVEGEKLGTFNIEKLIAKRTP